MWRVLANTVMESRVQYNALCFLIAWRAEELYSMELVTAKCQHDVTVF
jgi:hypothetical protein